MKKLIISSVLGVAVAASTAFGQGYVSFGSGLHIVWDNASTTSTTPTFDTGFDATFLWNASSSTTPMYMASTPTNGTAGAILASTAWLDISNSVAGGSWTAATTGGTAMIGAPTSATGGFSYDGAAQLALDGNTSASEAINMFVVAWDTDGGLYTTLASAEAGDAPIGWSSVFSYTLAGAPPGSTAAKTAVPAFGIGPVPEPTTLALAGLGGLSMLFLRRKKA